MKRIERQGVRAWYCANQKEAPRMVPTLPIQIQFRSREAAIAFVAALVLCLIYLAVTGNLSDAYFFADDHEFFELHDGLNRYGFWKMYSLFPEVNGAAPRARLLFFLLRLLQIKLLGVNIFAHHFVSLVFTAGALACLYAAARKSGMVIFTASLSAFLVYAGPQAEILYRLGTSETQGMMFFALALWLVVEEANRDQSRMHSFSIVLSAIAASLCKESFHLAIPALVFLRVCLARPRSDSWRGALRSHLPSNVIVLLFMVGLCAVVLSRGSTDIGYAGVDRSSLSQISPLIWKLFLDLRLHTVFAVALLVLTVALLKRNAFEQWKAYAWGGFFVFLLGMHVVLYAKSGMLPRYYVPLTVGSVFLITSSLDRLASSTRRWRGAATFICAFALLTVYSGPIRLAWSSAVEYGKESRAFTTFLEVLVNEGERHGEVLVVYTDARPSAFYEPALASIPAYVGHCGNPVKVMWSAPNIRPANQFELSHYRKMRTVLGGTFVDKPVPELLANFAVVGIYGEFSKDLADQRSCGVATECFSYNNRLHVSILKR